MDIWHALNLQVFPSWTELMDLPKTGHAVSLILHSMGIQELDPLVVHQLMELLHRKHYMVGDFIM